MVGLSRWMNDSKVEAPIRSPAAAKIVLGLVDSSCVTAPANWAAPASWHRWRAERPWKSLVAEDLDVDRSGVRGSRRDDGERRGDEPCEGGGKSDLATGS